MAGCFIYRPLLFQTKNNFIYAYKKQEKHKSFSCFLLFIFFRPSKYGYCDITKNFRFCFLIPLFF
ncbi:MAG TPA: hypothetical protein DCE65_09240 [Clostridiales bacterium]|nr:hypothetical protein [Clostridiales bacterium]